MAVKIRDQAAAALADADVALFVADAVEGLTPLDEELARTVLARFAGKVLVLANKVDSPAREPLALDFYRLGVDRVYPVSAEHAIGLDDVMAEVARRPSRRAAAAAEAGGERDPGRPRRPAERRQVLARQRAARGGARRRRRDAGHDAGRRRHPLLARRGALGARRHRGDPPPRPHPGRPREVQRAALEPRDRPRRRLRAGARRDGAGDRPGRAHRRGDRRGAARPASSSSTSGTSSTWARRPATSTGALLAERLKHLAWAPVLLASALSGRNIAKLLDLARAAYREYSPRDPDAGAQRVLPPGRRGVQAADAQGPQDLDGLHHPGVDAAADVRGARQRRRAGALHLPPLPREPDARAVRLRRHVDRAALPQQGAPRRGEARGGQGRTPASPSTASSAAASRPSGTASAARARKAGPREGGRAAAREGEARRAEDDGPQERFAQARRK